MPLKQTLPIWVDKMIVSAHSIRGVTLCCYLRPLCVGQESMSGEVLESSCSRNFQKMAWILPVSRHVCQGSSSPQTGRVRDSALCQTELRSMKKLSTTIPVGYRRKSAGAKAGPQTFPLTLAGKRVPMPWLDARTPKGRLDTERSLQSKVW